MTKLLTIDEVAEHLNVGADKVREWCKSGELAAIDVSRQPSKKPHYRIAMRAVRLFVERRTTVVLKKHKRRRKLAIEQIV